MESNGKCNVKVVKDTGGHGAQIMSVLWRPITTSKKSSRTADLSPSPRTSDKLDDCTINLYSKEGELYSLMGEVEPEAISNSTEFSWINFEMDRTSSDSEYSSDMINIPNENVKVHGSFQQYLLSVHLLELLSWIKIPFHHK